MRAYHLIVICALSLFLVQCGNKAPKATIPPAQPEMVEPEVKEEITFESACESHVKRYCGCAKPLQEYVNKIKAGDSLIMDEYQRQQAMFQACFDPNKVISTYMKALDSTRKLYYMELRDSFMNIHCPTIIPGNQ